MYMDVIFPQNDVRFIAINDNVDSNKGEDDFTPFRNICNEILVKDTSRKIRAVNKMKVDRGERVSSNAPYGYLKDGKKLVVNPDTTPIVVKIFELCANGFGPSQIAKKLTAEKILSPNAYTYNRTGLEVYAKAMEFPYRWNSRTVRDILSYREYLGDTVNCKTYTNSYKDKRSKKTPKENLRIVENTHTSIIDKETWGIAQKVLEGNRRPTKMGEMDKFSGLVYCADCGERHYFCRGTTLLETQFNYVCGTYRKHKYPCTPHSMRVVILEDLVISHIQSVLSFAKNYEDEFVKQVSEKSSKEHKKTIERQKRELFKAQNRHSELNNLFKRIYEDNCSGKLSDERFELLSNEYEAEQQELKLSISNLSSAIETSIEKSQNVDRFLNIVKKYTTIEQLDAVTLRELIEKIVIHERVFFTSKKCSKYK